MFSSKPSPSPRGVPLGDLQSALKGTTLKVSREGDVLIVKHEQFVTRVEVSAPETAETVDGKISAIMTIRTEFPPELSGLLQMPGLIGVANRMATLGALTLDEGKIFVGSRLTLYEGDDAWKVQFGLILFAVIGAADSMMDATFTEKPPRQTGPSKWTEKDFNFVKSYLSRICVSTTGGLGLTAEFGIRNGEISAAAGHHYTALWQMFADQPHPQFGSGLFCMLTMPHDIDDEASLEKVLAELNRLEMQGNDLPPHFGAWCGGGSGTNPTYVSFLPNALHGPDNVALNMSVWAKSRAQMADTMLRTMGIR